MRMFSIFLLLMSALAGPVVAAENIEFDIYDADGSKFSSRDVGTRFTDEAGNPFPLQILLIYSPTLDAPDLRRQWDLLAANPGAAAELGVLYVTACAEAEDRRGYYTVPSVAMSLVADPSRFSTTLVRPGGEVVRQWLTPVSIDELAGQLLVSGVRDPMATP